MYDVSIAGEGVVASRFMKPRDDNRWAVMLIKEQVRRCEI